MPPLIVTGVRPFGVSFREDDLGAMTRCDMVQAEVPGAARQVLTSRDLVENAANAISEAGHSIVALLNEGLPVGARIGLDLTLQFRWCPRCWEPISGFEASDDVAGMVQMRPCGCHSLLDDLVRSCSTPTVIGSWRTYTDATRDAWVIEFVPRQPGTWADPDSDPIGDLIAVRDRARDRGPTRAAYERFRREYENRWSGWRDFADDDMPDEARIPPPPDPALFRTYPTETPLGEHGYGEMVIAQVERCWRCYDGVSVDEDLGLCQTCIDYLKATSEETSDG